MTMARIWTSHPTNPPSPSILMLLLSRVQTRSRYQGEEERAACLGLSTAQPAALCEERGGTVDRNCRFKATRTGPKATKPVPISRTVYAFRFSIVSRGWILTHMKLTLSDCCLLRDKNWLQDAHRWTKEYLGAPWEGYTTFGKQNVCPKLLHKVLMDNSSQLWEVGYRLVSLNFLQTFWWLTRHRSHAVLCVCFGSANSE